MDGRAKWDVKKKGYLKIHIAVNAKTKKIHSIKVTADEHVHDSKPLPELVENIIKSYSVTVAIGKLFADGVMRVMIILDVWRTMESCLVSK